MIEITNKEEGITKISQEGEENTKIKEKTIESLMTIDIQKMKLNIKENNKKK